MTHNLSSPYESRKVASFFFQQLCHGLVHKTTTTLTTAPNFRLQLTSCSSRRQPTNYEQLSNANPTSNSNQHDQKNNKRERVTNQIHFVNKCPSHFTAFILRPPVSICEYYHPSYHLWPFPSLLVASKFRKCPQTHVSCHWTVPVPTRAPGNVVPYHPHCITRTIPMP